MRQGRDGKRASPMIQPAVVRAAHVNDDLITFVLTDGREVSAPTAWSRPLSAASQEQRDQFEIEPAGLIVERPALDEHIGVWAPLGMSEEDAIEAVGFSAAEVASA